MISFHHHLLPINWKHEGASVCLFCKPALQKKKKSIIDIGYILISIFLIPQKDKYNYAIFFFNCSGYKWLSIFFDLALSLNLIKSNELENNKNKKTAKT